MGGRFRVDNSLFVGYPESARVGVGRAARNAVVDPRGRRPAMLIKDEVSDAMSEKVTETSNLVAEAREPGLDDIEAVARGDVRGRRKVGEGRKGREDRLDAPLAPRSGSHAV